MAFGSEIDGRVIRGKGGRSLLLNVHQYNLVSVFGYVYICLGYDKYTPTSCSGGGQEDL